MTKTERLLRIAERKGVKVTFKRRKSYRGVYDYPTHSIVINKDISSRREILYLLAHELGHAHYQHGGMWVKTVRGAFNYMWDNEIEAWNYASRLAKRVGFFNKYFVKCRNDCLGANLRVLKKVWRIK